MMIRRCVVGLFENMVENMRCICCNVICTR